MCLLQIRDALPGTQRRRTGVSSGARGKGLSPLLLVAGLACALLLGCTQQPVALTEAVYQRLDEVRDRKAQQLVDYLHKAAATAESVMDDRQMIDLYAEKLELYRRTAVQAENEDLTLPLLRVRDRIEDRYIDQYLLFHDIMFIDADGEVFFTIRRKADYRQNIFAGELAGTALANALREDPKGGFVDFENYLIAGEASAFFIVRNRSPGGGGGWFVFQFSINKLNDMFSLEESLGQTGEVFLVNRERAMLTDSRFFAESTVLSQHLSPENINSKFAENEGHKKVIDYRGFTALTSFKVVTVFGSQWLLIAKIDEDEVLTEAFRKAGNSLLLAMEKDALAIQPRPHDFAPVADRLIEVDWDEFRRSGAPGSVLYTHGVRTCTAVIINYPGEFSYMAHISANDAVYGGKVTDLLRIIQKRIDSLELSRARKRDLQVTIISPIPQYKVNVIEALADWGVLLSQVRLIFNDQARHANVYHFPDKAETLIEWKHADSYQPLRTRAGVYPTLGELVERHL